MKKIVSLLVILLAALFVQNSFAVSLHPDSYVKSAHLDTFKPDANAWFSHYDLIGGDITVDQMAGTIELFIQTSKRCPRGMMCTMEAVGPVQIKLKLTRVQQNSCGATVYVAERNMMPVDGAYETLKVVDNSTNECRYFHAIPGTVVTYTSSYYARGSNPGMVSSQSVFTGKGYLEMGRISDDLPDNGDGITFLPEEPIDYDLHHYEF